MQALVPYAARGVGSLAYRGMLYRKNLNLFDPRVRLAARTMGRVARGFLARRRVGKMRARRSTPNKALFSRRKIGEHVASTNAKSRQLASETGIARNSRTIYSLDLTTIPRVDDISGRERQHVNMRGFKICMQITNILDNPLYFNQAVIAPKSTDTGVTTANFFRNNTSDRTVDFGNALSSLEFHCLPINSDDYVILKHTRHLLLSRTASTTNHHRQYGSSYIDIDYYVSLKRQVRYIKGESSTATDGRVFHVFWFDARGAASGAVPASCATTGFRIVSYFREPKH